MAVHRLADELLQMILAPSLTISYSQFFSVSVKVFGQNDMVSSASVLLVCKRWLRVATPLLYETVVIRSAGQSHVLSAVFRRNPVFATHVKNLRLEGAFPSLSSVLPPCTNLVTLVLILEIYSDTNVTDLCRALLLINPVEVILHDTRDKDNVKIRTVLRTLCDAIPTWTALTSFWFPYGQISGSAPMDRASQISRRDRLIDALMQSKSLKVFFGSCAQFRAGQWRRLARDSSLSFKFFCEHRYPPCSEENFQSQREKAGIDPALASRIELIKHPNSRDIETWEEPVPGPSSPFITFKDFSFEAISDDIWNMIFAFAATPDSLPPPHPDILNWMVPRLVNATRRMISLTCKRFERLIRPIFFEVPVLPSNTSLKAFTEKIVDQPHLGRLVHTLIFSGHCEKLWAYNIELFLILIPHLTQLRHFHAGDSLYSGDPANVFGCLARTVGDTLLAISGLGCGPSPPQSLSIAMFASFKVLKTLELPEVCVISDLGIHLPSQPFACLSSLEMRAYGDIWRTISTIRLPALKSVKLFGPPELIQMGNFLRTSGSKLEHICLEGFVDFAEVFSLAPNILSIDWEPRLHDPDGSSMMKDSLEKPAAHTKLEIFTIQTVLGGNTAERDHTMMATIIFSRFSRNGFPSLKEIHFPAYVWPVDERSISRHELPRTAAILKSVHNIDILDRSGKPWRVRTQGGR